MNAKTPKSTKSTPSPALMPPFADLMSGFGNGAPATFPFAPAFRDMAEKSATQMRDTYARMKTAAEEATDLVETSVEAARDGALALGVKALDVVKANSDASFALARELFAAKTWSDVIELQSTFARKRFEASAAQFKELQALTEKVVTEATKPVAAQVKKTFNGLKVVA
jgi:phasin